MQVVSQRVASRPGPAGIFALLALFAAALCLGGCSSMLGGGSTEQPIATSLPTPTATSTPTSPTDALSTEIEKGTELKGSIIGPILMPLADGIQCNFHDNLSSPSLQDVQADAYQIFKAIWTGRLYHIPADWKVHLTFYIGASIMGPGTPIAVANLTYTTAQSFPWAKLTPQQAWLQYDGVLFDANGLCTVPSCAQPTP